MDGVGRQLAKYGRKLILGGTESVDGVGLDEEEVEAKVRSIEADERRAERDLIGRRNYQGNAEYDYYDIGVGGRPNCTDYWKPVVPVFGDPGEELVSFLPQHMTVHTSCMQQGGHPVLCLLFKRKGGACFAPF